MGRQIDTKILENNRQRHEALRREYYSRAQESGIAADRKTIPVSDDIHLKRSRQRLRHIRAYYAQILASMEDHSESMNAAYGLVDTDGCLVRMKGTEKILDWLSGKGIVLGAEWTFDATGSNAVTIGLSTMRCISTAGRENYLQVLQDAAIYFAPLHLKNTKKEYRFGGIVIFTRLADASSVYLSNAAAIADSLMIRVSMAYRTSEAFDGIETKGMVLLDINAKNGAVTMTHHNKALFKILEQKPMTYQEMYFRPFDEFADPLPRNERLWKVINDLEEVQDEEMTLSVKGRSIDCIVTTRPHMHETISTKGTLLYITTKTEISHEVSRHTSNGAILSNVDIIGQSNIIRSRISKARLLANTDSNVMILGESGTGKDIFAQAIHNMSARRNRPFIAVNCGALPRDLIESELFGYEGGAFTGARKQGNLGKFELADGGTLFLDEIGELPLDLQATLLRAVEQKSFMRLGSSKLVRADVKIISATNADIQRMIDEKRFRSDLYYRLSTMQLFLPPLRERGEDAVLLADHFARRIAQRTGRGTPILSEGAKEFIRRCPWKGNVRELQNVMECVVQLYPEDVITWEQLEENVDYAYIPALMNAPGTEIEKKEAAAAEQSDPGDGSGGARTARRQPRRPGRGNGHMMTREELMDALDECGGNRSEAARLLGVGRKTLYRYLERYGLL